ncbi:hypothetical protein ONZ51_g10575 [Trametes cubensis]|uniref:Uncharacterized protein n=1 Tax=Trametes cubensis TaxID=1111947 RepID=A0AAD7TJ72_9APHY|nr:hypothetical protein ONZ51_g10575 [Trametes cubensis]
MRATMRTPTPTPTPIQTSTPMAPIAADDVFVAEQAGSSLPHTGGESSAEAHGERDQEREDAAVDPSAAPPSQGCEPEPERIRRPDVNTPPPNTELEEPAAEQLPQAASPLDSPSRAQHTISGEERRTYVPSEHGSPRAQDVQAPVVTVVTKPGVVAPQTETPTQSSVDMAVAPSEPSSAHPPPPPPAAPDLELESGDEDAEGSIDEEVDHLK